MTRRRRKKRNNKIIPLLIILIIIAILVPTMTSLSKYVYNAVQDYYLGSKGFYFNSDKLTTDHAEFEIANNWSGAETYTITINLNSKKNDLLFAETDIDYTVNLTHSDNIECELSKNSGTIIGSQNGGINEDYFTIKINPAGGQALANGETTWVEVEVTSTSPYEKTLSGRLIVGVGTEDISYEIMDSENSPYLEVNITNSLDVGKDVKLSFDPNIILLDMTSSYYLNSSATTTTEINGYSYVNSVTSFVDTLQTTTVRFYKVDPTQNYTHETGSTEPPVITLTY